MNRLVNLLLTDYAGELVGSRAWGGSTAESDWDVIVPVEHRGKIPDIEFKQRENEEEIYAHDAHIDCGYVDCDGEVVNILFLHCRTFAAWSAASKAILGLPENVRIDRLRRRYIFTLLVDALRHLPGSVS